MSRLRSYEPSFVSVFWLKEKNVHVRGFTSKWRSYMCLQWHLSPSWFSTAGINWKVSIVLYCHFFCRSERHAALTQIQVCKFVSMLLQLYIFITAVTDWCERRLEKCIVFIMYAYSYKERKEEKKHYHNINFGCDWGTIKMFNFFPLFPGLCERPPSPKRVSLQLKNKDYCKMQEVERCPQTRHRACQFAEAQRHAQK